MTLTAPRRLSNRPRLVALSYGVVVYAASWPRSAAAGFR